MSSSRFHDISRRREAGMIRGHRHEPKYVTTSTRTTRSLKKDKEQKTTATTTYYYGQSTSSWDDGFIMACETQFQRDAKTHGGISQEDYAKFLYEYCSISPFRGPTCYVEPDRTTTTSSLPLLFTTLPVSIQQTFRDGQTTPSCSSSSDSSLHNSKVSTLDCPNAFSTESDIYNLCMSTSTRLQPDGLMVDVNHRDFGWKHEEQQQAMMMTSSTKVDTSPEEDFPPTNSPIEASVDEDKDDADADEENPSSSPAPSFRSDEPSTSPSMTTPVSPSVDDGDNHDDILMEMKSLVDDDYHEPMNNGNDNDPVVVLTKTTNSTTSDTAEEKEEDVDNELENDGGEFGTQVPPPLPPLYQGPQDLVVNNTDTGLGGEDGHGGELGMQHDDDVIIPHVSLNGDDGFGGSRSVHDNGVGGGVGRMVALVGLVLGLVCVLIMSIGIMMQMWNNHRNRRRRWMMLLGDGGYDHHGRRHHRRRQQRGQDRRQHGMLFPMMGGRRHGGNGRVANAAADNYYHEHVNLHNIDPALDGDESIISDSSHILRAIQTTTMMMSGYNNNDDDDDDNASGTRTNNHHYHTTTNNNNGSIGYTYSGTDDDSFASTALDSFDSMDFATVTTADSLDNVRGRTRSSRRRQQQRQRQQQSSSSAPWSLSSLSNWGSDATMLDRIDATTTTTTRGMQYYNYDTTIQEEDEEDDEEEEADSKAEDDDDYSAMESSLASGSVFLQLQMQEQEKGRQQEQEQDKVEQQHRQHPSVLYLNRTKKRDQNSKGELSQHSNSSRRVLHDDGGDDRQGSSIAKETKQSIACNESGRGSGSRSGLKVLCGHNNNCNRNEEEEEEEARKMMKEEETETKSQITSTSTTRPGTPVPPSPCDPKLLSSHLLEPPLKERPSSFSSSSSTSVSTSTSTSSSSTSPTTEAKSRRQQQQDQISRRQPSQPPGRHAGQTTENGWSSSSFWTKTTGGQQQQDGGVVASLSSLSTSSSSSSSSCFSISSSSCSSSVSSRHNTDTNNNISGGGDGSRSAGRNRRCRQLEPKQQQQLQVGWRNRAESPPSVEFCGRVDDDDDDENVNRSNSTFDNYANDSSDNVACKEELQRYSPRKYDAL